MLLTIAICVIALFFFFRSNTLRGSEAVRAALYLRMLDIGESEGDANQYVATPVVDFPSEVIRAAIMYLNVKHDGKQLPMIRHAYSRGMLSRLPSWYRSVAGLKA